MKIKKPILYKVTVTILMTYLVPCMAGLLFSKLYWGYFFYPPSIELPNYDIDRIEVLVRLDKYKAFDRTKNLELKKVKTKDIEKSAFLYSLHESDTPTSRLPYYLKKYHLMPVNNEILNEFEIQDIAIKAFSHMRKANIFVSSTEGYYSQRQAFGYLAIGTLNNKDTIIIITISGGQVSNDHFPQYNVVYSMDSVGELKLLNQTVYYEDIAGIEGFRFFYAIILFAVVWTLLLIVIAIIYFFAKALAFLIKSRIP